MDSAQFSALIAISIDSTFGIGWSHKPETADELWCLEGIAVLDAFGPTSAKDAGGETIPTTMTRAAIVAVNTCRVLRMRVLSSIGSFRTGPCSLGMAITDRNPFASDCSPRTQQKRH